MELQVAMKMYNKRILKQNIQQEVIVVLMTSKEKNV